MPPNAVRQSEYERMTRVYGNIDSGRSSLQIDTSNFFKTDEGKDISLLSDPMGYMAAVQNAAQFRGQYMGYMQDLVRTPAGLQRERDPRADGCSAARDVLRSALERARHLGATGRCGAASSP